MSPTPTNSTPSPKLSDHKPKLIPGNDLKSLATYMKSDRCQNVFLMLGAGVSTAAGIPDFRSPNTGLYANLARLNLPYPEAVFQIDFFRKNPVPFYTLAKELFPGRFTPTLTHTFISLLNTHSLLHTCFTQNIDTLERLAGVPEDKIIEAHGSFATQRCIDCKTPFDSGKMKKAVEKGEVPRCERRRCGGLVKPDIVFFGESLPKEFHSSVLTLHQADLLIIIGTSLTVHPFASLVDFVPETCPRVLINLVDVGRFDRKDDMVFLGRCDDVVRKLSRELGWEEELQKTWRGIGRGGRDLTEVRGKEREGTGQADKEDPLDKITKDMERALAFSEDDASAKVDHGRPKAEEGEHKVGSSDLAEKDFVDGKQEE